jgi:hypothetical protein
MGGTVGDITSKTLPHDTMPRRSELFIELQRQSGNAKKEKWHKPPFLYTQQCPMN